MVETGDPHFWDATDGKALAWLRSIDPTAVVVESLNPDGARIVGGSAIVVSDVFGVALATADLASAALLTPAQLRDLARALRALAAP